MESNAYDGLACKMQQGRIPRHNEVNNLIQRALVQARIPARLEPSNLSRTDGKRPDGITTLLHGMTAKALSGTLPVRIHYVKLM